MTVRRTVGTVVAVGLLFAACGSSDKNGGNVTVSGAGGHAGGAAGQAGGGPAGGAGGASCNGMYDELLDKVGLFEGDWLIDNAATNQTCPNALTEAIYPETFVPAPADPEAQGACPAPSAFYTIATGTVKDCVQQVACPSAHSSLGFFIHAHRKGTPIVYSEMLYSNSDGAWDRIGIQDENVEVTTDHKLLFFGNTYYRGTDRAGDCRNDI